jgi:hypothetical protein
MPIKEVRLSLETTHSAIAPQATRAEPQDFKEISEFNLSPSVTRGQPPGIVHIEEQQSTPVYSHGTL